MTTWSSIMTRRLLVLTDATWSGYQRLYPTVGPLSAYYYTISDFDSNNFILTVPASLLGITPDTPIGFQVFAFNGYVGGPSLGRIPG